MTAAGKVPPAKVLVVGAGVAGLAAIGAAGSLGAIVRATDPRPEVADQVKSLGGEYLSVEPSEAEVSATGYAKEMGDDYKAREARAVRRAGQGRRHHHHHRADPRQARAAHHHRRHGGLDEAGQRDRRHGRRPTAATSRAPSRTRPIVTDNGVTIIGYTDLAGRLPAQASQLYGTNLVNLLKLLTPEKDGQLVLDFDDVVQRSMTVVRDGEITWPPPPVQVSAAPAAARRPRRSSAKPAKKPMPTAAPARRSTFAAAAVLFLLTALSPDRAASVHLTVFALAIVIGYYVIGNVHHALHTPLMSVTNAISGIIVVGALLQIGHDDAVVTALAVRGDPARQHQHLRRLRRDPPHAGHVLEELSTCSHSRPPPPRRTSSPPCCSSWRWPGCPSTRRRRRGNAFGIAGMAVALVATIALALARHIEPLGLGAAGRRHGHRRRDRPVARARSSR